MTDWLSPDYWLSFISLPVWIGAALAAVIAVWWFLGIRGALAAGVALLSLIAYRHGRDTQREALTRRIRDDQDKSEGIINEQERVARDLGRAAADGVRRKGTGSSANR
jgi:hypothetical protein